MTIPITKEEIQTANAAFLKKVWTDEAFGARFESDPRAVFTEMGQEVPDDIEIKVVRDTDTVKYLHIPAAPAEGEVSDADLLGAQGGTTPFCVVSIVSATVVTYYTSIGTH